MSDLSKRELESKIAFLERHVEEQDRVILKLSQNLASLTEEIGNIKQAMQAAEQSLPGHPDEKPPHY